MARRSLRPQHNQIRSWVMQGRTDAWIAHQLDVSVREIEAFKRDNELAPEGGEGPPSETPLDEIDLRAEDDALIAAELEAAESLDDEPDESDEDALDGVDADEGPRRGRRRGRRGGRGRRGTARALEGTFDHGEEGYGLWLDPAVQDDPVYAEHWAGHRPVAVSIEEDRIVIRRAGDDG
jgi:hypothetical protein